MILLFKIRKKEIQIVARIFQLTDVILLQERPDGSLELAAVTA